MSASESDRHELYQTLEGIMGKRSRDTIMSLLPPTGWGDVATQRDLDALRAATKQDLEILESRINERIMRTALTVNTPSIFAAVALSFAATRLA